ncbi:hypothetical protein CDAR_231681 [Caerostris darwini]|uniref:Uncharacterized protein n=1 Tax=Caerostris darwini TaxID=1538125 RepID=A0AAV4X4L4_9ARAC|nr:hypothetical protein CDAR_231551 [Caerostris darwini]GIY90102.1 hypothetical protein CDAR_231681 [Caerostris darwini]
MRFYTTDKLSENKKFLFSSLLWLVKFCSHTEAFLCALSMQDLTELLGFSPSLMPHSRFRSVLEEGDCHMRANGYSRLFFHGGYSFDMCWKKGKRNRGNKSNSSSTVSGFFLCTENSRCEFIIFFPCVYVLMH